MVLKVLFLGIAPSKKNLDPSKAFIGTNSHKRLIEWAQIVGLADEEIFLENCINIYTPSPKACDIDYARLSDKIAGYDLVVCLGKMPYDAVSKVTKNKPIAMFYMPHPSGLNRMLNNKDLLQIHLDAFRHVLLRIRRILF